MQPSPDVSPELFWDVITGYQRTAILKAAVELDFFTAIDNGASSAAEIADKTGAAERGVRIICDSLTVLGFLTKTGNSYALTPSTATFLSKRSPAYLGSITDFIAAPEISRGFDSLTEAARQGGTAVVGDASIDPESPMWVTFARAMMPMMVPPANAMAATLGGDPDRPLKVLDIAAGHGIFGITMAKNFPNARVYALDWKNVLEVAKENAERFGVADRFETLPGNAFEVQFGGGFDVILLTNFLHHFDTETCVSILKKCHAALKQGGKLMTLEFVPNEDRVSPPQEALFAAIMLAGTPSGDAYTFNALKEMCDTAGFATTEHIPLPPTPQHLVLSTK